MPRKSSSTGSASRQVPKLPKMWDAAQLADDAVQSQALFRLRRESELIAPDSSYAIAYGALYTAAVEVVACLPELRSGPAAAELLASWVERQDHGLVLRSLSGPPISEDDLQTLLQTPITSARLRHDPDLAEALASLVWRSLDRYRFAWIVQDRQASPQDIHAAVVSTAVVAAIARTQTQRRSDERDQLEDAVASVLTGIGLQPVRRNSARLATTLQWPAPGHFMRHATLGEHNADFVIRLHDGRIAALECKASNSALNSRKRLNKEAERDAKHWIEHFGAQVVPCVALRGVFDARLVEQAQKAGLFVFWSHRLGDLTTFIESTR